MPLTARPTEAERAVVYGPDMHARTYAAMLERARDAVGRGRPVLLDATYVRRSSRMDAYELARSLGCPFAIVDAHAAPDVIRDRLRTRAAQNADASDAGWDIYEAQMQAMDPFGDAERPHVTRFDTEQPPEHAVLPLLEILESQLDARREPLGPDRAREETQ